LGGGMAITVDGNRLDAEWVCSDGVVRDRFTMMKDVKKKETYTIYEGDSISITSSWKGVHNWTGGMTSDTVKVSPIGLDIDTLTVVDDHNCLVDSFIVTKALRLPVELLSFTAEKQANNQVLLKWSTASEFNNAYFNVEWSTDMINFTSIGIVAGAGNSSQVLNYQLLHENPAQGMNYYRLRQVNMDSSVSFSGIASVNIDLASAVVNSKSSFIYVYPNPSQTGSYEVDYYSQKRKTAQLRVHNILGKLIYSDILQVNNGITHYDLNIVNIPAGIYFISVDEDVIKILK
jgi:hypothetical protein